MTPAMKLFLVALLAVLVGVMSRLVVCAILVFALLAGVLLVVLSVFLVLAALMEVVVELVLLVVLVLVELVVVACGQSVVGDSDDTKMRYGQGG